jgi:autotransporter translocation and assembly factor TamB
VCWGTLYVNLNVAPNQAILNTQPLLGPVISYDFNGDNELGSLSFHAAGNQLSGGSSAQVQLRNLDSVTRRAKGWFVTTIGCV